MAAPSPFHPELFGFVRDLRANNEKPWFEAFEETCRAGIPVMKWLCDAVGVAF